MDQKKPTRFEKIGVIIAIGVILWTARLGVITILGDHWFGTFGVTSGVLGTITYLSWCGKMGRFGQIYKSILTNKITKKLTKVRLGFAIFTILLFGSFSAGIHAGESLYQNTTEKFQTQIEKESPEILDQKRITDSIYSDITQKPAETAGGVAVGLVLLPVIMMSNFEDYSAMIAVMNRVFDSQLVHLIDIILVEEIEVFALLFFVSYVQRRPKTITSN